MKKTIIALTLIFALLLTTGCAASNVDPNGLDAMQSDADIALAANETPDGEVAPEQATAPAEVLIGMDQAQQTALDHAGLAVSDVSGLKVGYDAEDGEYDVEFLAGGYEYDYSIGAFSGKILSCSKENEAPAEKPTEKAAEDATEKATEKASEKATEKATKATEKATEKSTKATKATEAAKTLIGKDKAKSIAFKHAGVSSSKAKNVKVEYDKDDGKYEVDFRVGDYEYDYSIGAYSGKVLSHEKEYDPVSTKATEKATQKPTEAKKELIGKDKAKSIAFKHAGVSSSKATNVKVEYDKDDGKYEVDFRVGDYEYEYSIGAYSGKVLSHDKEYDPAPTKATEKPTEKPTEAKKEVIGKDKAKSIAFKHAGVSSSKATNVKVEYDKDDGEYEVDFRVGDYEYEYTIGAYSGKVLSHDKEYDPAPTKATEKPTEKPTEEKKELIGKDKAKSIALKHAGLSSSDVTGLQVEYDKDDGVPVYEVEFNYNRKEYSYEIHGYTGKILSREVDD